MPNIFITSIPPGEAPENVRQAWVGMKLEIAGGQLAPQEYDVVGIISGGLNWKSRLLRRLGIDARKMERWLGYPVAFLPAVQALEYEGRLEAARWWAENTPHLLHPDHVVIFPASCCRAEEDE